MIKWFDLDFNFETCSVLVLDVLGTAKASELAATDHDS